MSAQTSNVISFPPAREGTGDGPVPATSLLEECRGLVVERLGTAISAGFDKVIDELYELAEHALERDKRDFYLKAKEAWPQQRAPVEATFREQLANRFSPPVERDKEEQPQFALVKSAWTELALVADGDLEEDMRFTELASKIRNGADEELVALDQRVAILLERPELEPADNPLAPTGIADAFREALKQVEFDIEIKRIAIRHFDEHVRPEALAVIREINERLKKNGILPVIRYGSSKKPQTGTGPVDGPRDDGPQVIGSVTLPVMSGGSSPAGSVMAGGLSIGGMGVQMPAGASMAGAAATMTLQPGVGLPGGTGMDPAGAFSAGLVPGGALARSPAGLAGPEGFAADGGGAGDPFAMLQQLLLANMAAGRSVPMPGGAGGGMPGGSGGTGAHGAFPAAPGSGVPGGTGLGMPGFTGQAAPGGGLVPGLGGPFGPGGGATPGAGGAFPGAGQPGVGVSRFAGQGPGGGLGNAGGIPGTAGASEFPGGGGIPGPGGMPGIGGTHGGGSGGAPGIAGAGTGIPGVNEYGIPGAGGAEPGGPGSAGGGFGGGVAGPGGVASGADAGGPGSDAQSGIDVNATQSLAGSRLIGSLTRLQQGDIGELPDVSQDVGDWLAHPRRPREDRLTDADAPNVLRALKSTSLGRKMGQMDTVTLDIVSMLFDQIFGDPRIPAAMKALIGRLQIPMLKVAVLDKTFFSRKSHPARHMLDTLGELSLGLGEGFDTSSALHARIESTLTTVVDEFEEDMGVFERITAELEALIHELENVADDSARREAGRIHDRERLEVARLFAQNELRKRLQGDPLPRAVLRFLSTEWMKLMILAYAKGGREGRSWTGLVETMDILVWSLSPKHTIDDRKRLVSLLPGLLKRLGKGMDVIGTDKAVRERFNAVLMRCHARTITGGTATSKDPRAVARAAARAAAMTAPASSGIPSTATTPGPSVTPTLAPRGAVVPERPAAPAEPESPANSRTPAPTPAPTAETVARITSTTVTSAPTSVRAESKVSDTIPGLPPVFENHPEATPPTPAVDTSVVLSASSARASSAGNTAVTRTLSGTVPPAGTTKPALDAPPTVTSSTRDAPPAGSTAAASTDGTSIDISAPLDFPIGRNDMDVEEVAFDSAAAFAPAAAPTPAPLTTTQRAPTDDMPTLSGATATALEAPSFQGEMTLESAPTNFPTVRVRNPFGDGEIEVEEVNFGNLPGFAPAAAQAKAPPPDAAAQLAAELKEGDWFELRQEGKDATQARLSLVSPYRSTFVFSNRKGQKVAECSLYQVTSYLRAGRLARLQETPLFDRAFGNIVSLLRGGPDAPA